MPPFCIVCNNPYICCTCSKTAEAELPVNNVVSPEIELIEELKKITNAGDKLAEAAHYVQKNFDGIHRLRLALSEWYKVKANEFGRG